ncbi:MULTISPECIES: AI-2E family transporter [Parabacteroides]|uniref:AI-2E family transporter n=1 Tax=Parabacteroides provencensis TaxID=1944636 RepID=UPI000C16189B|nr:AI-2E family transporter [Parabacteroides provencensis]
MNPLFDKPFTFDRVVRILFSVATLAGIIYLIALLRNALLPFLIAWLLAYLMQPFVRFFQYKMKLKSRILAIIAVLLSTILIIALMGIIVVPSVTQEINRTLELMKEHNGYNHIPLLPSAWVEFIDKHVDPEQLVQIMSKENIENAIKQIAPQMWVLLTNTFSVLFSITIIFVIFLYFIFILLDYERIANGWIHLIPSRYRPFVQDLAEDVEYSMNRYFRGQSLIALCVGILFAIGFKIVGFPLAVVLGLFIGFLNLIPYMQAIGIIPMVLLSLLKSAETGENFWMIFGSGILVLGIVQCIQDLYLTPRIMGKAMGMNPAIILLSLSIWGTLLGFVGLIVALPLTTLFLSYYKRFILMEESSVIDKKKKNPTASGEKTEPKK